MKIVLSTFLFLVFSVPVSLSAQVVFTEIMYSPDGADGGREWIEVKNTGESAIDLGTWKLFENETNHYIRAVEEGGNTELPAGGFAVIADNPASFLADWAGFSGLLLDSAFSLLNTGETLVLRDSELVDIDTVSYNGAWGADGDGNSLQLVGGEWIPVAPTPGEENADAPEPSLEEDEPETPPSVSSGVGQTISPPSAPLFTARISEKEKFAVVGAPARFKGETVGTTEGLSGKTRFLWNFGDGGITEGQNIFHTYKHPGEYIVVLNAVSGEHAASDRAVIKAIPAELSVSRIGDASDFFIELSNNSAYELNLSGWLLKSGLGYFVVPEHTFILPKKKIIFPKETTRLAFSDDGTASLLYPNGTTAHVFVEEIPPASALYSPPQKEYAESTVAPPLQKEAVTVGAREEESSPLLLPETFLENTEDESLVAAPEKAVEKFSYPRAIWLFGVLALVLAGGAGVVLMRRGRTLADEFTITDGENDSV